MAITNPDTAAAPKIPQLPEELIASTTFLLKRLGFAAKEHLAVAEKLMAVPPKERFDRVVVDKMSDSRERYLRKLRRLIEKVRLLDHQVDEAFAAWSARITRFAKGRMR